MLVWLTREHQNGTKTLWFFQFTTKSSKFIWKWYSRSPCQCWSGHCHCGIWKFFINKRHYDKNVSLLVGPHRNPTQTSALSIVSDNTARVFSRNSFWVIFELKECILLQLKNSVQTNAPDKSRCEAKRFETKRMETGKNRQIKENGMKLKWNKIKTEKNEKWDKTTETALYILSK